LVRTLDRYSQNASAKRRSESLQIIDWIGRRRNGDGEEALEYLFGCGEATRQSEISAVVLLDCTRSGIERPEVLRRVMSDDKLKAGYGFGAHLIASGKDLIPTYRLGVNFLSD